MCGEGGKSVKSVAGSSSPQSVGGTYVEVDVGKDSSEELFNDYDHSRPRHLSQSMHYCQQNSVARNLPMFMSVKRQSGSLGSEMLVSREVIRPEFI